MRFMRLDIVRAARVRHAAKGRRGHAYRARYVAFNGAVGA